MNLGEVIQKVDSLYPNTYSIKEKIDWCFEVSASIRNEVDKKYEFRSTDVSKLFDVIDEIGILFVCSIISKTIIHPKTDVQTWYNNGFSILPPDVTGEVRVVYVTQPDRYRDVSYNGGAVIKDNIIDISEKRDFHVGDSVNICYVGYEHIGKILCADGSFVIGGCSLTDFSGEIAITKLLDETLECICPYDNMYIDFVLGKMCYYQQDYDNYNQHMAQYNNKIMLYQKWVKAREAYNKDCSLSMLWS